MNIALQDIDQEERSKEALDSRLIEVISFGTKSL